MQDTFITCAITGAGDGPKRNPNVPVSPGSIARSALAAAEAGAAIVHIHVRNPETGEGCREDKLYEQVVDQIRDSNTEVIVNLTAGMGGNAVFGSEAPVPLEPESDLVGPFERLTHVEKIRPDICTLDCGSFNADDSDLVYVSTSGYIRKGGIRIREIGVRPELEIFDLGHLQNVLRLMDEGVFDDPVMMQFCLGVPFGAPAETATMQLMADMVRERSVIWSAFGVGRMQLPMVAQSVLLGGHVRVGLEDNLYLKRGVPATNEELVQKAAELIDTLGGKIMSASAARDVLQLDHA